MARQSHLLLGVLPLLLETCCAIARAEPSASGDELMALGDADMAAAERAMAAKPIVEGLVETIAESKIGKGVKDAADYMRAEVTRNVKLAVDKVMGQEFGKRDLAFIHVPSNFGQSVERVALGPLGGQELLLRGALGAKHEQQLAALRLAQAPGGEVWGQLWPELRAISNVTGCNLFHTPQKHWPAALASSYLAGRRPFALLRDPYDRLVSEFRQQASGGGRGATDLKRREVSEREGNMEREGQQYLDFYSNCDLNGWVKEELSRVKQGDRHRGNCHLLPQAEYFEHPHGISLALDGRLIPESFNEAMEEHGYNIRMDAGSVHHNWSCNKLSAWSLDDDAKELVRDVYADDFALLCRTFGYCDSEELTCMQQLPMMCGGSPYDNTGRFFGVP